MRRAEIPNGFPHFALLNAGYNLRPEAFHADLGLALRQLTLDDLRASLDRAFPGEFLPQRDDRSFVVEGETPGEPYFIKSLVGGAEGMFLLHHQVGSAEDWSDMDFDDTDDPVFRRLVRADHSMMSIHMIKAMAGADAA
jgi:hypothetical protein